MLGNVAFGGGKGDGFEAVRCGGDVAKALIGKKMSNETVMVVEKRHQDIGLKDLGADEISDRLNAISWLICGSEYLVLEDRDVVRDVIKVPEHSKAAPQFLGYCQVNGKDAGLVVAILDNSKGAGEAGGTGQAMLPAKVAWKIDEKKGKFVSVPVEGMRCPRSGIITGDGGL